MATKGLKQVITADTSGYSRSIRQAKADLKSFESVSRSAFSKMGNAVGLNTDNISKAIGTVRELGERIKNMGTEGSKAFGTVLQSIAPVGAAISGLGIAAATVAFKALNSEANYFRNTLAGNDIQLGMQAYTDTFKQSLADARGIGMEVLEQQASLKEFYARQGATLGHALKTGIVDGWGDGPTLGAIQYEAEKTQQFNDQITEAVGKAKQAKQLALEIDDLEEKMQQDQATIFEYQTKINEARGVMMNSTKSSAERSQAIKEAEKAINDMYGLQLDNLRSLYDKKVELNSLATSTEDAVKGEWDLAAQIKRVEAERAGALASIERREGSIATAAEKEAKAHQKSLELVEKLRSDLEQTLDLRVDFDQDKLSDLSGVIKREVRVDVHGLEQIEKLAGKTNDIDFKVKGLELIEDLAGKTNDIDFKVKGLEQIEDLAGKTNDIDFKVTGLEKLITVLNRVNDFDMSIDTEGIDKAISQLSKLKGQKISVDSAEIDDALAKFDELRGLNIKIDESRLDVLLDRLEELKDQKITFDDAEIIALIEHLEGLKNQKITVAVSADQTELARSLTGRASVQFPVELAPKEPVEDTAKYIQFQLAQNAVYLKLDFDRQQIIDVGNEIKAVFQETITQVAENFGELLASIGQDDAFGNFGSNMLSTLGGMVSSLGQILISVGSAVIAFNAAISTMSIPGAIALIGAGALLVSLGSAAKSVASNSAGSYSAGSSVASSYTSASISTGDYAQKEVNVKVSGTLQASGSTLVAVLNNEEKRTRRTT